MAAHRAPPSLGFSRQEHWSTLPFPSPVCESEGEAAQLCPTLSDPMDRSLAGSSIHGIFQARILEWGAIAFSKILARHMKDKIICQGPQDRVKPNHQLAQRSSHVGAESSSSLTRRHPGEQTGGRQTDWKVVLHSG